MDPDDIDNDEFDDDPSAFGDAFAEASGSPSPEDPPGDGSSDDGDEGSSAAAGAAGGSPSSDGGDPDGAGGEGRSAQDEIWEGATPEQVEAYKAILRDRDEMAHKARSDAGRVHALQTQVAELRAAVDASANTGGEEPTDAEIQTALQSAEGWESFVEEYPNIAKVIKGALTTVASATSKRLDKRLSETVNPVLERQERTDTEAAKAALEERYPGWVEVVNTGEFNEWLLKQPVQVVSLINSHDAADAAALFDYYANGTGHVWKDAEGPPGRDREDGQHTAGSAVQKRLEERRRRVEQGEGVPRRGAPRKPADSGSFHDAFAAAAAERDRQRAQRG